MTLPFKPLAVTELADILSATIKEDTANKTITFLCELSAFTENSQFNISFNAPSSTGKSFIPTEIAQLFPKDDVMEIAYCSPTAFFHDAGQYDKAIGGYQVDLSRKILIFLDQPHMQLLERLRPLLSHDKKEIHSKITDKSEKHGMRTKNIIIKGFPAVIFCTAGLRVDEQETTRFLLLSPEMGQEKIKQAVEAKIRKEADSQSYYEWLDANPQRKLLKERIAAIKGEGINEIKIKEPKVIQDAFFKQNHILKPRHQRDIGRLIALVKSLALLNLWWRDQHGTTITANEEDVAAAFELWAKISPSQDLNLPPVVYDLYKEVVLVGCQEKITGLATNSEQPSMNRHEVLQKYYEIYGRPLDPIQLRQQFLPMLEMAGLIIQEPDPLDKRKMLIFPVLPIKPGEENSESQGGVNYLAGQEGEINVDDIPF